MNKKGTLKDGFPWFCVRNQASFDDELKIEQPMKVASPTMGQRAINKINRVRYDPTGLHYDMTGKKIMLIFNHYEFNPASFGAPPSKREGTFSDVESLQNTFGNIGFTIQTCHDYTHREIIRQIQSLCSMNHENTSCISIVILTHGDEGGLVFASDMTYSVDTIINQLIYEPKLAGKPKLFFIQACRGGNLDSGHRISSDSRESMIIPSHSDCFIMKASFNGFVSFRTSMGSWMIQALCEVVKEYKDQDMLTIATRVCNKVSKEISYSPQFLQHHYKKQTVVNFFSLTKFLYLNGEAMY